MLTKQKNDLSLESLRSFLKKLFPPEFRHLVWLAGGTVRDTLLDREISDIDLVAALPSGLLESLGFIHIEALTTSPIWFRHFREYGNVEITVVAGTDALTADLKRRDFTLNAMLMSLEGEIFDPLDGQSDLKSLTLEPCSDKTFRHDPIRIFRAFRFVAEGFCLSAEAAAQIRSRRWEEALLRMPIERFSREMLKALQGEHPGRFFLQMVETDVGRGMLPELFSMPRIPAGPLQHHPEGDLFAHSIEVLERLSAVTGSPLARFCAFFHDIGKLSTEPSLYPRHHGHDKAGFKTAAEFCRRLALPSEYGRALAWTSRLHGKANRFCELRPATRIRMAEQSLRGGIAELLPLISAADKPGNDIADHWGEVLGVAGMNMAALGIDTEQLNLLKPENRSAFILQRRLEVMKIFARPVNPISNQE